MVDTNNNSGAQDPRWFIWTIVFLIVSGVSLVSYIFITGNRESSEAMFIPVQRRVVNSAQ